MKHLVITIARHYGSGGRTVGLMLAKELGINCYDREILRMASDASGINEALFERADERLKSNLFRVSSKVYKGQLITPDKDDFVSNDNLFNYQAKVIKELADQHTTMIIVIHEMAFARDVANKVVFMDGGIIVEQGDPKEVFGNPKEERTKQFLSRFTQG